MDKICNFDHFFKISGRIRVAWHSNGEEEVVKEKNVGLADRSLMPGDVVRRLIEGKDTQRGKNMMTSRAVVSTGSTGSIEPVDFWKRHNGTYEIAKIARIKSVHF